MKKLFLSVLPALALFSVTPVFAAQHCTSDCEKMCLENGKDSCGQCKKNPKVNDTVKVPRERFHGRGDL